MNEKTINKRQAVLLTALLLLGNTVLVGGVSSNARQNDWIAQLLSAVVILPMYLMYTRIVRLLPNQGLFDMFFTLFGKIGGCIFSIIMIVYAFSIAVVVIRSFTEFVSVTSLPYTPQLFMAFILSALCAWLVMSGPGNLGRLSTLAFLWVAVITVSTFLLGLGNMDVGNLGPVGREDVRPIVKDGLFMAALPFGQAVIMLPLFGQIKEHKKNARVLLWGLLLGNIFIMISLMRNILMLGDKTFFESYFPSYMAVSMISLGDFFQRFEAFVSSNLLISVFMKIAICYYAIENGFSKMVRTPFRAKMILPAVALIAAALSSVIVKDTLQLKDFRQITVLYSPLFQVIIPAVVWIAAEIKNKKRHKTKKERENPAVAVSRSL